MENKTYLAQLKVLYVEDDQETRQGLSTFLKRRVGKLYTAEDGASGYTLFCEQNPDIVIADLLMPKMHGMKMLVKMREHDPECKFIITSSVNETDTVLNAVDVGIVKYVVKPISLPALDETLQKTAAELRREHVGAFALEADEKRKYEAKIKKEVALFLKQIAGKGPRDVAVFIHDNSIDIVAYDTLTPLEQRLMTKPANYSIVEQARRYFYRASETDILELVQGALSRQAKLDQIEIRPDKGTDKLVFRIV